MAGDAVLVIVLATNVCLVFLGAACGQRDLVFAASMNIALALGGLWLLRQRYDE